MQIAFGLAGAAAGSFVPFIGPGLGWAIGSTIGGMLGGSDKQVNAQPLMDLRIPGTQDGRPIPWIRGAMRVAPDWIWHTDRRATTTSTTSSAGKGSGPEVENQSTTYDMDCLLMLNINGCVGISEVYRSGELIWRTDSGASAGTIAASNATDHWERLTVYTGASDQLPDPDYESAVGAGHAPAYRGRATVFIKGLQLGSGGQVPQLEFTVVVDGESGPEINYYDQDLTSTAAEESASVYLDSVGEVWTVDSGYNPAPAYGPLRVAVFDTADQTTEFFTLETGYWLPNSSEIVRFYSIEDSDLILIGAHSNALAGPTVLVYQISTRAFVAAWDDELGHTFALYGVDVANNRVFGSHPGTGFKIYALDPSTYTPVGGALATYSGGSYSATRSFPNTSGLFYCITRSPNVCWKYGVAGASSFALDADDADSSPGDHDEFAHDTSRHRLYYWSLSQTWLKYIDMDDDSSGRVNTTAYANKAKVLVEPITDRIYLVRGGSSPPFSVHDVNPDDGDDYDEYEIPDGGGAHFDGSPAFTSGIVWGASSQWTGAATESGLGELIFNALTAACPSVPTVQSAVAVRAGLTAAQINVTPLNALSREVCAFPWSQISAARVPTELMMSVYFYETVMSGGKVKFVPRGESEVATLSYDDLGGDDDPFPLRFINDLESPAHNVINYINLSANYQQGSEKSDRLISASPVTVEPIEVAVGMEPTEAKGVIDTMLRDRASSIARARIRLLRSDYPTLEPTDPIIVTGRDGSEWRMRIVNMDESFPTIDCDIVLDDPNVLSAQGITTTDYESQTTVTLPANTTMRLIDPPILRDEDDSAGLYVLAKGTNSSWRGAAILDSSNDVDYTRRDTISEAATFGSCTTTLGDWTGPRLFDKLNTVTVNVGDGTLTSSTRALVLSTQETNACMVGDELLQFVTATLVSPGVYTLSTLLRGSRGTEWAMVDHAAGEAFSLLSRSGMRRVSLENAQLSALRYYKGVTLGRSVASVSAQTFTTDGVGLKPFSPVRLRGSRDGSNNATLEIERRTRLAVRMVGSLGVSVPLGEESESYEWDVYDDDTYTTLVRTLTSITTSVAYSAAQQTTDGLTPGDPLHVKVYQLSAIVGRGYALQRAA
jgi:hypothetical protein